MRLYRIEWYDDHVGRQYRYAGSVADARAERRKVVNDGWKMSEIEVKPVNVPTNKKELLNWLNVNAIPDTP